MARPTPQELQAARKLKAEERRREEKEAEQRIVDEEARLRAEREARVATTIPSMERLAFLRDSQPKVSQLESVLDGLYTEMDKLSKKAPADQVTELALKRVNEVIKRGKELMAGDEFVDNATLFL